jgi:HPt (histidine-containing phosphotransfer) domain-containing protein
MILDLESAMNEGDAEKLHRAAHSLKGMLGNYYAQRAFEQAKELDDRARAGALEEARKQFPELKQEVDRLRSALNNFRDTLGGPGA